MFIPQMWFFTSVMTQIAIETTIILESSEPQRCWIWSAREPCSTRKSWDYRLNLLFLTSFQTMISVHAPCIGLVCRVWYVLYLKWPFSGLPRPISGPNPTGPQGCHGRNFNMEFPIEKEVSSQHSKQSNPENNTHFPRISQHGMNPDPPSFLKLGLTQEINSLRISLDIQREYPLVMTHIAIENCHL